MAPRKPTPTERLVTVVTNLERIVLDMQEKMGCCYNIINKQQEIIELLSAKIDKNTQLLLEIKAPPATSNTTVTEKNNSPGQNNHLFKRHCDSKSSPLMIQPDIVTKVPKILRLSSLNALNNSGPEGITLHNTDTNVDDEPNNTSPRPNAGRRWEPTSAITGQPLSRPLVSPRGASIPVAPATGIPCGLQAAAPRSINLHLFNLSKGTTVEDISKHVESKMGMKNINCEKLVVTRGDYSSFRLEVPASKVHIIKNSNNWPEGVSIRKFNVVESKNSQPRFRKPSPR
ncbi:hypothetical protein O0L34_g5821 [Tuta absoluta]|nr:hypothetical protein O0L34_g5821 [Tuta absoluta]